MDATAMGARYADTVAAIARPRAMTAQQIVRLHRSLRRVGRWDFDLKHDAERLARRLNAR